MNDDKAAKAKLAEDRRHNEEMEKAARGDGIFLDQTQALKSGRGLREALHGVADKIGDLEDESKKKVAEVLESVTPFFKVSKQGNGLFLDPKI